VASGAFCCAEIQNPKIKRIKIISMKESDAPSLWHSTREGSQIGKRSNIETKLGSPNSLLICRLQNFSLVVLFSDGNLCIGNEHFGGALAQCLIGSLKSTWTITVYQMG